MTGMGSTEPGSPVWNDLAPFSSSSSPNAPRGRHALRRDASRAGHDAAALGPGPGGRFPRLRDPPLPAPAGARRRPAVPHRGHDRSVARPGHPRVLRRHLGALQPRRLRAGPVRHAAPDRHGVRLRLLPVDLERTPQGGGHRGRLGALERNPGLLRQFVLGAEGRELPPELLRCAARGTPELPAGHRLVPVRSRWRRRGRHGVDPPRRTRRRVIGRFDPEQSLVVHEQRHELACKQRAPGFHFGSTARTSRRVHEDRPILDRARALGIPSRLDGGDRGVLSRVRSRARAARPL